MAITGFAEFKIIRPEQIPDNTFKLIGSDWMLLTAGSLPKYNTMTASWGGFGILWGKQICFCVVRPQRYTYEFMESERYFTLSFFDESYRNALSFCGSNSGREVVPEHVAPGHGARTRGVNKAVQAGLTPVEANPGRVYFQEARLVIECQKVYFQDLDPSNFLSADIEKNYPDKDYHRMYIGEIEQCYLKS